MFVTLNNYDSDANDRFFNTQQAECKPYPNHYKLYQVSAANTRLLYIYGTWSRDFYKTADAPAIFGYFYTGSYYGPILVSKYENGVYMTYQQSSTGGTIQYKGETWYISDSAYWTNGTANYVYNNLPILTSTDKTSAVNELLYRYHHNGEYK